MSDKLNILTSNIIRFVAGERPTADKFNAMNQYYSRSIENICRAIGDMTCTGVSESYAKTLEEIIDEVASTRITERGGRADDKRSEAAMEDRKKEGYF